MRGLCVWQPGYWLSGNRENRLRDGEQLQRAASILRNDLTYAESLLHRRTKDKQLGFNVCCFVDIGNAYIAQFYVQRVRMAIEIDGADENVRRIEQHDQRREYVRKANGISVLRLTADQVSQHLDHAVRSIVYRVENLKVIRKANGRRDGGDEFAQLLKERERQIQAVVGRSQSGERRKLRR